MSQNKFGSLENITNYVDKFYKFTAIPVVLTGMDGRVLFACGLQEICTKFPQPDSAGTYKCKRNANCARNPVACLAGEYVIYKCNTGLTHAAGAISTGGKDLAKVFLGPLLNSEPDMDYYVRQARDLDTPLPQYIEMLNKVTVVSEEKFESGIKCFAYLMEIVTNGGLKEQEKAQRCDALIGQLQEHSIRNMGFAATVPAKTLDKLTGSGRVFARTGRSIHVVQYSAERKVIDNSACKFYAANLLPVMREGRLENEKRKGYGVSWELLAECSHDIILFLGHDGKILQANNAAFKAYGYSREELLEMDMAALEAVLPTEPTQAAARRGNSDGTMETMHRRKNGSVFPVEISFQKVEVVGGNIIISVVRDISKRKLMEDKIRFLNYHDKLTELYNRTYFEEKIKQLDGEGCIPLSIVVGDMNALKLANDAFGHHAGDKMLVTVAKILKDSCRKGDVIARWGGDEFVIILPNTDKAAAQAVCERIKRACESTAVGPVALSIALGLGTKEKISQDIRLVIREAEDKMYREKLSECKNTRRFILASLEKTLWDGRHETKEHIRRLQEMSIRMGYILGLSERELTGLAVLAAMHDIGKVAIPKTILNKPGKLTPEEWATMQRHCEIGYRIAEYSAEAFPMAAAVLAHHERWDGTGYPLGLKGDEIPLPARMIAIVDAYDVMVSGRPYKAAVSHQDAIDEIQRCSGSQFDPEMVNVFMEALYKKEERIPACQINTG